MLHQLARFITLTPLIAELGPGDVLDVGSGRRGVAGWLGPAWRVTAVDRSFDLDVALPGPFEPDVTTIEGDARALPFPDGSFDVAVAFDVLEHIDPADRPRVLDELVRVARRRVVVACPAGAAALDSDRRLAARLRARGATPPEWLVEHEENGFPERVELAERLAGRGRLRMLANESVRWHELVFRFESRSPGFRASRAAGRAVAARLGRRGPAGVAGRLAARAAHGPRRGPAYRTVAVLDLD